MPMNSAELLQALIDLTTELRRSRFKMEVRKDYHLMVAEAAATKAIYNAHICEEEKAANLLIQKVYKGEATISAEGVIR